MTVVRCLSGVSSLPRQHYSSFDNLSGSSRRCTEARRGPAATASATLVSAQCRSAWRSRAACSSSSSEAVCGSCEAGHLEFWCQVSHCWRCRLRRHLERVYKLLGMMLVGPGGKTNHTTVTSFFHAEQLLLHPQTRSCWGSHQRQQSLTPYKAPRCSSLVRGPRGAAAGSPAAKGTQRAPRGHQGR